MTNHSRSERGRSRTSAFSITLGRMVRSGGPPVAAAVLAAWSYRVRTHKAPWPYALRWWLYAPRPFLMRRDVLRAVCPEPGERILEIGPGVGRHTLSVASRVQPTGRVDAVDLQPEMLRYLERRAQRHGVENIVGRCADATALPYPPATFDAVFLVTVLSEIHDPSGALGEFSRVLKPNGRLVVGEMMPDPRFLTSKSVQCRAAQWGLELEHRFGPRLAYLARFRTRDYMHAARLRRPLFRTVV